MLSGRIYALLLLGFTVLVAGDYFTKLWTRDYNTGSFAVACACYLAVTAMWFVIISTEPNLGRMGTIWTVCSMLAAVTTGVCFFGEYLSTTNRIGIFLCILGVILTSR